MPSYSTYKGARLNLEAYQGRSTVDYEIEILNDGGSEFDFSIYSSTVFQLYYRQHGETIIAPTITLSDNFGLLDLTKAQSAALQTREYWYEWYGVLVSPVNEHELITFGTFKVI